MGGSSLNNSNNKKNSNSPEDSFAQLVFHMFDLLLQSARKKANARKSQAQAKRPQKKPNSRTHLQNVQKKL